MWICIHFTTRIILFIWEQNLTIFRFQRIIYRLRSIRPLFILVIIDFVFFLFDKIIKIVRILTRSWLIILLQLISTFRCTKRLNWVFAHYRILRLRNLIISRSYVHWWFSNLICFFIHSKTSRNFTKSIANLIFSGTRYIFWDFILRRSNNWIWLIDIIDFLLGISYFVEIRSWSVIGRIVWIFRRISKLLADCRWIVFDRIEWVLLIWTRDIL